MIILYYLSEEASHQFAYNTAQKIMEVHTLVTIRNRKEFTSFFETYNYEDNEVVICAHGGTDGISKTQNIDDSFISWIDLLDLIEKMNVEHKIKLNLCAVCNSFNITNAVIPNVIELILYSNTSVNSIIAAIDLFANDYQTRINNYEDDETGELLYGFI